MNSPGPLEPNHRILVIDDNQAIHDDLRKILLGEVATQESLQDDEALLLGVEPMPITRFHIESAFQGQDGLALLERELAEGRPYAMAFVDIRMPPGWDGIETITRLWRVDPNLQVVICTAYSDYSWNDIQRRLGQSENLLVLKKPFDNIEVIQLAHALTRKWLVSSQANSRLEDLDLMVAQRTAELETANHRIQVQFDEKSAAEEAFRTVFESSPIGISLCGPDGRYVDVNSAMETLLGMAKDSLIGRDPVAAGWIGGPDDSEALRQAFQDGRGLDTYEAVYRNAKSGNGTGLLWVRRVLIGGAPFCLSFLLDISLRKRMEEELVSARLGADAAAKAKSEFLANMSHEIRTPLNGILGLSFLLEEESLPDDLRPLMGLIRTSGEVLRRVLDDVLDFSKIDSGMLELEESPFDIRECLRWSFELFRKMAEDKGLEYTLHIDTDLPAVLSGDSTRLRQITANLVSNAVKFTKTGSIEMHAEVVDVPLDQDRRLIRISVRDTGIGIPEDQIGRLFQSFSQVDASTSRRYGGTGLGLAISRRLVEMMGGEIRVESRAGAGSTFEFTIAAGLVIGELPAAAAVANRNLQGLRILVAEDNKVNQMVTIRMLQKLGCEVEVASDGVVAVDKIEVDSFDIVLMDLEMPLMDGLEATRRIRRFPSAQSAVPIVALTASASEDVRAECQAAGMNDYLTKPMDFQSLRRTVERWGASCISR